MAFIKFVTGEHCNVDAVSNLINYICDWGSNTYLGGLAVSTHDVNSAIRDFLIVKNIFHQNEGRQAIHFILSFNEEEEEIINADMALSLGYLIAKHYNKYQVIFAVHNNTDNLHIHFVINSVNYIDGCRYAEGPDGYYRLKSHVDTVIENFLCSVGNYSVANIS